MMEWVSPTLELVKYALKINKIEDHYCEWGLFSISVWNIDKTYDPKSFNLVVSGSTKWDGCSDFYFAEGYEHFCELYEWQDFRKALEWAYTSAYNVIQNKGRDIPQPPKGEQVKRLMFTHPLVKDGIPIELKRLNLEPTVLGPNVEMGKLTINYKDGMKQELLVSNARAVENLCLVELANNQKLE